ncbi:hypothetical protein G6011_08203 [Alternaria panax]|uniref:Uncharacterized protein n=1 Tax=Alternaria panax TaxID=48097 RepID=A0AAD4FIQ5_9PLEO|nr:hypothetical protein G6011_08203 [Alternaria panax]
MTQELKSKIRTQIVLVERYAQAIARLSDTIEDECMSMIKTRHQFWQTRLGADEKQHGPVVTRMLHTERLSEGSCVPVISIAELSQVASAEAKALENMTSLNLAISQLIANRADLEQEIKGKIEEKGRTHVGPVESAEVTREDNEIQELKSSIEEYADMI